MSSLILYKNLDTKVTRLIIVVLFSCCMISCRNASESFTVNQLVSVKDSVQEMAEAIARDISHEGPGAWLRYFENTPDFFMASEGQLVFPNYDSAALFIKNILIKSISKIELGWSNIRIDPLTAKLANLSASFHEDITDASGKTISQDGYFTGIAENTISGWKLRNAHWSIISKK